MKRLWLWTGLFLSGTAVTGCAGSSAKLPSIKLEIDPPASPPPVVVVPAPVVQQPVAADHRSGS